jgi:hypothetical protein
MEPEGFGLLFAILEPPETMEDEFNDWYDTEHIPERIAVPGILTCQRFVCHDCSPKYLALYDLENAGVLESEPYQNIGPNHYSPWTKRINRHARVFIRKVYEQTSPGKARLSGNAGALVVQEYDVLPGKEAQLDQWFDRRFLPSMQKMGGYISIRRFTCVDGSPRYLSLIEFEDPCFVENEPFREIFPGWQGVEKDIDHAGQRIYRRYQRG